MLAALFYVLGAAAIIGGGFWMWVVLTTSGASGNNGATLAMVLVASPGFAILMAGLLLLALATGLYLLERIERHTRDTADAMRDIAKR